MTSLVLSRRLFTSGLAASVAGRTALAAATPRALQFGLAGGPRERWLEINRLRRRLATYRQLGFQWLRLDIGRFGSSIDLQSSPVKAAVNYMREAVQQGFQLKPSLGSSASTPDGFFNEHPDALPRNGAGETVMGYISPWYPNVAAILQLETETRVQLLTANKLMPAIASYVLELGPASEPLYPASWQITERKSQASESFWFRDPHATEAFGNGMRQRYGADLSAANRSWGTAFKDWTNVRLPSEGSANKNLWRDVIEWYRTSKRNHVEQLVASTIRTVGKAAEGRQPTPVILIPGTHIEESDLDRVANQLGQQCAAVCQMLDTKFLVNLAAKYGCVVQPTAAHNEAEIRYIQQQISQSHRSIAVIGENSGGPNSRRPGALIDIARRNMLSGIEYINGDYLFDGPGDQTNETYEELKRAMQ